MSLDYSVHILNVLCYIVYILELFLVKIFLYKENPLRALSGLKSNNQAKIIYPQKDEKHNLPLANEKCVS